MASVAIATSGARTPPRQRWGSICRPPLPPFPEYTDGQPPAPRGGCWASVPTWSDKRQAIVDHSYVTTPIVAPPPAPSRDYLRGNFQLIVPGFRGGFNDKDRQLWMTWEGPQNSDADQQVALDYYAGVYTHLVASIPQARNNGVLDRLCPFLRRASDRGLWNILNVYGGDDEDWDADILPILDPIVAQRLVQYLNVAWQIDAQNKTWRDGDFIAASNRVCDYALARGLEVMQHWINGATALWPYPQYGIFSAQDYGRYFEGRIRWQLFQADTETDVGEVQSGVQSAQRQHPPSTIVIPTELETQAQAGYSNDPNGLVSGPKVRLQGYSDLKGLLASMVSKGGYLCGAQRPGVEGLVL